MPIISLFFGIVSRINFGDHAPPDSFSFPCRPNSGAALTAP